MASLIAALAGTAQIGAFSDKLAGKHLEYLQDETGSVPEPPWRVESFDALLERAQTDALTAYFGGQRLVIESDDLKLFNRLGSIRDAIEHPKPLIHLFPLRYVLEPVPIAARLVVWLFMHPSIAHHVGRSRLRRAQYSGAAIARLCNRYLSAGHG